MAWLQRFLSSVLPAGRRGNFEFDCAAITDCGLVRAENQDHLVVYRGRAAFCVADGMGGGEGGAKASEIVCGHFTRAVARRTGFADRIRRVDESVCAANTAIRKFADVAGYRHMGSTVAALVFDAFDSGKAAVGSVGDSRVYRYRGGALEQLTRDHTMANELCRRSRGIVMNSGLSGRASALSHVLTRAVGIEQSVEVEWRQVDFRAGDWFMLCSDGLYDMVDADGIRSAFASGGRPRDVAMRLAAGAVLGGALDNYSVIVVKVRARR